MEEFAKRVEEALWRSNTVLIDHLFAKVSFALNMCVLAQHHLGPEKAERQQIAYRIYCEVVAFTEHRGHLLTEELTSAMNLLELELMKLGVFVDHPSIL